MTGHAQSFPELEPGDLELARRILDGDREAFDSFFEAHFPALYRFTLPRVNDSELARDLVQTAICKAIDNLRSYRGEASLSAWLFTICRYEIQGYYRQRRRRPKPVELPDDEFETRAILDSLSADSPLHPMQPSPEEDLQRQELAHLVHSTLDRLPARYGQALEWKYIDGVGVKEIAARLEVGPKAAESLLTRARQAFRDGFSSWGRSFESGSRASL